MYMREMGSVELLTREGEIEIAKRIEGGLMAMMLAISASPATIAEILRMAADIRESTTLMKESVKFERFATIMDKFVSSVRLGIRRSGGWFDKFTGDGFICYWLIEKEFAETMDMVLDFCCSVMDNFRSYYYPAFVAMTKSEDTVEGPRAFAEKRAPVWHGR